MTPTELHQKRQARTALKNTDRYRKEAAFFKQRNQTLVGDMRREVKNLTDSKEAELKRQEEVLKKTESELRDYVLQLEGRLRWLENIWLVRFALWILPNKQTPIL